MINNDLCAKIKKIKSIVFFMKKKYHKPCVFYAITQVSICMFILYKLEQIIIVDNMRLGVPDSSGIMCLSKFLCKGTSGLIMFKVKPVVLVENLHTFG